MATKSQARRAAQIEARMRKAFPDLFVIGVHVDEDGWLCGYLRPVDGGPFAREIWFPDDFSPVAQIAAMVERWATAQLPRLTN
jgi:hypothetical protein